MHVKNLKTLRLIAMTLGIAGCAVMCCSLTAPATGNSSVSLLEYMDVKVMNAFGLIMMGAVFLLFGYAVPQILNGLFAAIWAGFMCWETTGYLSVNPGLGMYLFILSAVFMLASGILFFVHKKHSRFGPSGIIPMPFGKIEVFCTVSMGLSILLFSVFEVLKIRP